MANEQLTPSLFDNLPENPDAEQIASITLKNWKAHLKEVENLEKQISKIIDAAVKEAARLGRRINPADIGRVFSKNPTLRNAFDTAMKRLAEDLTSTIEQGSKEAWLRSNANSNGIILQMAAGNAALAALLQSQQTKPQNDRALLAFQKREVAGMNLSQRVWKIAEATKRDIERAVEVALAEGTPATKLSQRVRQLLQEPNRLYRRVRDKDGNLRLSQAAKQYKPGQGVYRSSYKNAMRLARTEVNMAYHAADNERWKKSWWVRGIRIWLSNNHTVKDSKGQPQPLVDICDELMGDYPADFKFTGWHPQCRCIATALTCSYADIRDYFRRKRAGEDMSNYTPPGTVKEPPAAFKDWLTNNADRLKAAAERGTTPFFIRDNAKYTGFKNIKATQATEPTSTATPNKPTIQERAKARHDARSQEDISRIQTAWSRRQLGRLYDECHANHIPQETYNALQEALNRGDLTYFKSHIILAQQAAARQAARTEANIANIRNKWNASRIENAGETKKVAAIRREIELQTITGISDIHRIMMQYYRQFPEEFNHKKIYFIEFDEAPKNGSFTLGYSRHNDCIAFNKHKSGKSSPMNELTKAMEKIRTGKKLSLEQHRSVETVVHELLHQKATKYVSLKPHSSGDHKRTAMEAMNELASRSTYTRFLRRMGANTDGAEAIMRNGDGYQNWIKRLLGFTDKAELHAAAVGEQFAVTLTTESYDTMDTQLYEFFKAHAKKGFTQSMDEVLEAFESGKKWNTYLKKWFD